MSKDDGFMRRGYDLYPEAAIAISTFQDSLIKKVDAAFNARKSWGKLKLSRCSSPNIGGSLRDGWWVSRTQNGSVGSRKAAVELGFWWDPPTPARKPIVYSVLWAPEPIVLERKALSATMESFTFRERLAVGSPMPETFDVHRQFVQLLDIMVKLLDSID